MTTTFDLLSGLRILVVEDEALIAEELRERLERTLTPLPNPR